ncbi:hypothetical protein Gotri_003930 [Gossypium trilobum]|uniref:DUF4283 domain-containing protein n=1 Tax=Gossypium trilobum TaxID=34281 RepID=A0A7J9F343_9ROSI|nr:hypothetical protein [Gossypium trilobum]
MTAVNPSCSEAAMEVKTVKLISEEKEELLKNIKKVKRADGLANETSRKIVSYRDTLVGEDFCNFEAYLEKEPVSMEEFDDCLNKPVLENIKDGIISITLSSDEKDRIRLKWDKILIIEAFGRTFGYQYLLFKLNQLWNLSGELQLIDLDSGFFVVQFSCFDDFEKVLKGGPWALEASFNLVAVWVRLPELLLEYYDPTILAKIGQSLGTLLRVDNATSSESRGKYARFCVQVNIESPLKQFILIDGRKQYLQFEGLDLFYFSCVIIGHRHENCPIILARSREATCSKVAATVETNHTFTAPVTLAYSHPMDMSTFSPSPANVSTVQHPIVEPAVSGTWLMVPRKSRPRKPFIEAALKSPTAAATFSADKAGPGSAEPAGSAAVKAAESQKVSRC